jgi:hypothetical protein
MRPLRREQNDQCVSGLLLDVGRHYGNSGYPNDEAGSDQFATRFWHLENGRADVRSPDPSKMASKNDLAVHSDKLRTFMGRDIRRYFLSALEAAFGRSSSKALSLRLV